MAGVLAWAAWTRAPALRAPVPVAYLAAWILGLGALRALQVALAPSSAGDGLAALLLISLAVLGAWIALGQGARVCSVGPSLKATLRATDLACRIPFGLGALLTSLMGAHALQRWRRARRAGSSRDAD